MTEGKSIRNDRCRNEKCRKCKYRRYLAQVFDIHIDWRDCPIQKECYETMSRIYYETGIEKTDILGSGSSYYWCDYKECWR